MSLWEWPRITTPAVKCPRQARKERAGCPLTTGPVLWNCCDYFNMPVNYPRLNEFPEWFMVEPDRLYQVRVGNDAMIRLGSELIRGIDVSVGDEATVLIQVLNQTGPPYGTEGP